jgi:hypothetical protein
VIKKNIIKNLQKKEMDRKDFLKFGAMAAVTVVGLKGVVSLLTDNHKSVPVSSHKAQSGYGGSAYGA